MCTNAIEREAAWPQARVILANAKQLKGTPGMALLLHVQVGGAEGGGGTKWFEHIKDTVHPGMERSEHTRPSSVPVHGGGGVCAENDARDFREGKHSAQCPEDCSLHTCSPNVHPQQPSVEAPPVTLESADCFVARAGSDPISHIVLGLVAVL